MCDYNFWLIPHLLDLQVPLSGPGLSVPQLQWIVYNDVFPRLSPV